MSVWTTYEDRIAARGGTKRNAALLREQRALTVKTADSLSFQSVLIDGEPHDVSIIDSDNLNEKKLMSLPGDTIRCGSLVDWADQHWLISEKDAHTEVYTRAKLLQCNHLLRWIDEGHILREQWCVIEDGTKYLTGEYEDQKYIVTRGDSRIAMTIGRNEHTMKFDRHHRFLIDDPASGHKHSYNLTKPLRVGHVYGDEGVYLFVLQETNSTDNDNMEMGIADYYLHFPREAEEERESPARDRRPPDGGEEKGKKVWL